VFAELRETRRLPGGRRKVLVAEASLAAAGDDEPLAGYRQVGDAAQTWSLRLAFIFIDDRPDRDADDEVGAGFSRFIRAAARAPGLGREVLLEAEIDQGREPRIGLERDVAALAAIAAGRAALGDVLLAAPRDNTIPALSGGDGYRDFVNKLRLADLRARR